MPDVPQLDWKSPEYQRQVFAQWKKGRQLARTNLLFLCNHILGYRDVSERVHGQIIDRLQKFWGGTDAIEHFVPELYNGKYDKYTPAVPIYDLDADTRYNLILFPRGHLKSTIATIAHTIQWIINYPNIRIFLSSGAGSQAKGFLSEIKQHFQFNETFRYFFPEFCPPEDKAADFGNQEEFTTPARRASADRPTKEPTVRWFAVGSIVSSGHYEVGKHDDLVDKENSRTPESIATVKEHFGHLGPLVETFNADRVNPAVLAKVGNIGWTDVIGTRYDYSDLYGTIIDEEAKKPKEKRIWGILSQSALVKGELYSPEAQALWPERMPVSELRKIAEDPARGPTILASQYLQNPITDSEGLVKSRDDIRWMPVSAVHKVYPQMRLGVTVDLAGMEVGKSSDNDNSVLNLHGYGHDGTLYFLEIHAGKFTPAEVIDRMFDLFKRHPRIRWFKIEKEAHARVLLPFLRGEMARRGVYLPVLELQRDNRTSKQHRIRGLQALFVRRAIAFAGTESEAIAGVRGAIASDTRFQIETEILRFPKYSHDDILDTMADALQDYDGQITSDVIPIQGAPIEREPAKDGEVRALVSPQVRDYMEQMIEQQAEQLVPDCTGW